MIRKGKFIIKGNLKRFSEIEDIKNNELWKMPHICMYLNSATSNFHTATNEKSGLTQTVSWPCREFPASLDATFTVGLKQSKISTVTSPKSQTTNSAALDGVQIGANNGF
jgi:hypothetical protein